MEGKTEGGAQGILGKRRALRERVRAVICWGLGDKGGQRRGELTDITENSAIFVGILYLVDIYKTRNSRYNN